MLFVTILVDIIQALGVSFVIIIAGIYLNKKGIITPGGSKCLSKVSYNVAMPCLLMANAIKGIDSTILLYSFPLLFLPFIQVSLGLLLGQLATKLARTKDDFKNSAIAAIAFGNSTGLPIILLDVIFKTANKTSEIAQFYPIRFLCIYLIFNPIIQWSIGTWLMSRRPSDSNNNKGEEKDKLNYMPKQVSNQFDKYDPNQDAIITDEKDKIQEKFYELYLKKFLNVFPVVKKIETEEFVSSINSDIEESHERLVNEIKSDQDSIKYKSKLKSFALKFFKIIWDKFLIPPVIGTLLGIFIGLISYKNSKLSNLFTVTNSAFYWLYKALEKIGQAAVPINLVLLGNALSKVKSFKNVPKITCLFVVISKMIIMPVIGIILATLLSKVYTPGDPQDDSFWLVFMMVSATPTANNIVVMSELFGQNKEHIASCILIEQLCSPILLTFSVSLIVWYTTVISE